MTPPANHAHISRVRPAGISDVEAVVEVINRAFLSEQFCVTGDRTDAADIRHRFETGIFYVIDNPSDRAGLQGAVYCSIDHSRGYLGLLAVDPGAQGQGHSRALLAAVEQHCRHAGCHFLDITVINVRDELFPLYARLGFAAFDIVPFPVPERSRQPLHLVKMTKPLFPLSQMTSPP
ncbi:MAG: GNAT family N-acetyltransferase [Betaproteobacteria bacterium]